MLTDDVPGERSSWGFTVADLPLDLVISWSVVACILIAVYLWRPQIHGVPATKYILAAQLGLTGGIVVNPYQSHDMAFVAFWWPMLTPLFWWGAIALSRKLGFRQTAGLTWSMHVIPALIGVVLGVLVYLGVVDMGLVVFSPSTPPHR